jgi:hypothetical protein
MLRISAGLIIFTLLVPVLSYMFSLQLYSGTMKFVQALSIVATVLASAKAQNATNPVVPPSMTLLYTMACDLGESLSINSPPTGLQRLAIPIIGGTFKGPRVSGKAFQTPWISRRRLTNP